MIKSIDLNNDNRIIYDLLYSAWLHIEIRSENAEGEQEWWVCYFLRFTSSVRIIEWNSLEFR